ncbi:MAG: hypothetical protein ACW986_19550 [Promethearchaeota archaeon]|jgi:hypothetical protein
MNKKEIKDLILKFGKKKSGYSDDRFGMGWLQSVRIARKDNSIYVSFWYNYNEDPYGDTVSTNAYFRGALLIDTKGKILAEKLRYDRKQWDASGPRNFKEINTFKALDRESLILRIKVQKYIKSKGFYMNKGLVYALNNITKELLDKSIERAKANERKSVQAIDI